MLNRVLVAIVLFILSSAPSARGERAVLVDRIVAVVDGKTLYRSDVLARARPWAAALDRDEGRGKDPDDVRRLHRALVEKMIDEVLVAADLEKARVTVTDDDVERAMTEVTKRNALTRAELVAEVKKQGWTIDGYREELRRQMLEMKWISLKVRPRVREPDAGTEEEKRQALQALLELERKKALAELRARAHVEIRW